MTENYIMTIGGECLIYPYVTDILLNGRVEEICLVYLPRLVYLLRLHRREVFLDDTILKKHGISV